jgi:hypothetical protein
MKRSAHKRPTYWRIGVSAYGRMGVWAYRRVGVLLLKPLFTWLPERGGTNRRRFEQKARSHRYAKCCGRITKISKRVFTVSYADTPIRRHADTGFSPHFATALLAVAIWLSAAPSMPAQLISAPFGLKWGETEGRIMAFAAHTGSGPQLMSGNAGRETIDLGGPFPSQRFQRLGFTFQSNRLVQVAVYYPVPEDTNEAGELLTGLRGEIEQSFGPGQLLETGTEKNAEGYLETRRVFRWEREGCAIWLVSMEVQNAGDAPHIPNSLSEPGTLQPARRGEISVVYANLGLGRQLEIESASTERLEARIHRSIPVAPTGAIAWPFKSLTTICTSSLVPSLPK